MPNRILRDGILSSEPVCSLGWPAEVLYRRLLSVADDYGRFSASTKLIRAACYPLQIDKVSDSDIGKWLAQVAEAGLVRVYPAKDGKRYLEIVKFGQQIRSKSKYPSPEDGVSEQLIADAKHPPAVAPVFVFEGGVEGGVEGDGPAAADPSPEPVADATAKSNRGSRLSDDWSLPDEWARWAVAKFPHWTPDTVLAIAAKFRDYWVAKTGKDATKRDWLATWRTWCTSGITQREHPAPTARRGVVVTKPDWLLEKERRAAELGGRRPEPQGGEVVGEAVEVRDGA